MISLKLNPCEGLDDAYLSTWEWLKDSVWFDSEIVAELWISSLVKEDCIACIA